MATDESYSSEEDSGFADDERLTCINTSTVSSKQTTNIETDEDSSENENDLVLDADIKRQQRMSLLSLLYSRALDKKIMNTRRKKASCICHN